MNIPMIPGRVAFNTKLCPSRTPKGSLALDMAKNIKDVYALLKQPLTDSSHLSSKSTKTVCSGSLTLM